MTSVNEGVVVNGNDGGPIASNMPDDDRYLFDLNGYVVVRGVLTPEEVQEANAAIDRHSSEMIQRSSGPLRNARKGTKMYGTGPGRKDLGRVLEWGAEDSRIFKSVLAHPKLVPYFHEILGRGYRMDHLPLVIAQDAGAEGFALHGGTINCRTGEYLPYLAYTCRNGSIHSALLGCNVILADHDAGDGGFCIVPGSHKANFAMPPAMLDGDKYAEFIRQPVTKAGDVILFAEGTVHGALPWTCEERQRRVCLYRFAPPTNAYGRSYLYEHDDKDNGEEEETSSSSSSRRRGWPSAMYDDLSEAQLAVLEPPYACRLDRPTIQPDGSIHVEQRDAPKKQHDKNLFGTKYF